MKLMYDKENRIYLTLIGLFCLGLTVSCIVVGILQGPVVRDSLFEWEKTTASSLLEQGVDTGTIAEAFHSQVTTAEGEQLISRIGHTEENISLLFPEARMAVLQTGAGCLAFGMIMSALLISVSVTFLMKREKTYERATKKIERYAEGDFSERLTKGGTGGLDHFYLVSYEENQFRWAEDDLMSGSFTEAVNGNGVLAVYMDSDRKFDPGEQMTLELPEKTEKVEICGTLSESMFNVPDGSVVFICSEDMFTKLTGIDGYSVVNVQFTSGVTDRDVEEIRALAGDGVSVEGYRTGNSEVRGAYYSFALFHYGFLAVIALISIFNIINSIAMSVSARMNEYGAMRAIGMSTAQMVRMVFPDSSGGCDHRSYDTLSCDGCAGAGKTYS